MPLRTSSARWQGNLIDGSGVFMTGTSGGPTSKFSYKSRFEEDSGTNPEELIAAAHAGCFSMALAKVLTDAGHPPNAVQTSATIHLDKTDEGPKVTQVDLDTTGEVSDVDEAEFGRLAEEAKTSCTVSRLLWPGAKITLRATLA